MLRRTRLYCSVCVYKGVSCGPGGGYHQDEIRHNYPGDSQNVQKRLVVRQRPYIPYVRPAWYQPPRRALKQWGGGVGNGR